MALSWPNLPFALKAAIGVGKRTLGDRRQSGAPQGPRQGPRSHRGAKTSRTIAAGPAPAASLASAFSAAAAARGGVGSGRVDHENQIVGSVAPLGQRFLNVVAHRL